MNIPVRIALTVLVAALLGAVRTDAQAADAPAANVARRAPRVGVVLSGGGARGIAHIGVLRVLEAEGVIADIVTGASMGALVGGLYAIGYTPAALDSLATGLEWESYFRDAPERRFQSLDRRFTGDRTLLTLPLEHGRVRLPTGAISGQRISQLLSRLTWDVHTERDFGRFRRPFAAIATDIVTGAAVVLDSGSLAEAMQASMSIPSLFPPARMNDRLLIDGGITRNLPARDARALGADILICSDVSAPLHPASRLHSLVDVLMQTVTIYMSASNEVERALCDVSIRPNADGLSAADFDRAAAWIARGMDAAAAARPQLRDIAARTSARRSDDHAAPRRGRILGDSVRAAAVLIDGVSGAPARSLHRALRLTDGWVTATRLDAAVTRAYATELFDQVRYRIEPREADTVIVVTATAREQDRLGIGLRFDDTYKASLLATARLRNRIGFGSTTQFDLRLGEQTRVAAHHVNVGIGGSRLTVETAAAYNRTPLPVVIAGERIDDARIDATAITTFAGVMLTDGAVVGLELRSDHSRARATMATGDTALRRSFTSGALIIRSNTLDRGAFPTRGALVSLRSEHALGNERFEQHVGHAQIAVPLARRLAVHGRATVGASSPEDALPAHYAFMLGGAYPSALFPETQVGFPGLRPQQFVGAATARLGGALQWEARRNVFATVRADVGYAGRTLRFDHEASMTGVGISLGALTPVGPLEVSAGTLVRKARIRVELSLGHPF